MESIERNFDTDMINRLMRERRSVFTQQFEPGKVIPQAIIEQILENANWAPTHKLTEPWRFTVFAGEGLKTLATRQAEIYKEFAGTGFKQAKYEQLLTRPLQCSHVIALGMKRHVQVPEMEEVAAVACAVQNIHLTVAAYGLGGYWTTGGITFLPQANALAGLDEPDLFMGFFYLGYVKVPSTDGKRRPIADKVTWVVE